MSTIDPNTLLVQMRAMAVQAQGIAPPTGADAAGGDFSALLKDALNQVNEYQQTSSGLAAQFERGDPSVDIAEVMVAMQKASVSFEAITQVRNRLVSAYQDIMNMPI